MRPHATQAIYPELANTRGSTHRRHGSDGRASWQAGSVPSAHHDANDRSRPLLVATGVRAPLQLKEQDRCYRRRPTWRPCAPRHGRIFLPLARTLTPSPGNPRGRCFDVPSGSPAAGEEGERADLPAHCRRRKRASLRILKWLLGDLVFSFVMTCNDTFGMFSYDDFLHFLVL